jgi:hypothetical protein
LKKLLWELRWVGKVGGFAPAYDDDLSVEERVHVVDLFQEFFVA